MAITRIGIANRALIGSAGGEAPFGLACRLGGSAGCSHGDLVGAARLRAHLVLVDPGRDDVLLGSQDATHGVARHPTHADVVGTTLVAITRVDASSVGNAVAGSDLAGGTRHATCCHDLRRSLLAIRSDATIDNTAHADSADSDDIDSSLVALARTNPTLGLSTRHACTRGSSLRPGRSHRNDLDTRALAFTRTATGRDPIELTARRIASAHGSVGAHGIGIVGPHSSVGAHGIGIVGPHSIVGTHVIIGAHVIVGAHGIVGAGTDHRAHGHDLGLRNVALSRAAIYVARGATVGRRT